MRTQEQIETMVDRIVTEYERQSSDDQGGVSGEIEALNDFVTWLTADYVSDETVTDYFETP